MLYKALVRIHLEYANSVWYPYLKKDVEAIERVQRRGTKLIPSLHDLTYEDRLRALKLPTLKFRRLHGDMFEVYKIMTDKYDPDVGSILTKDEGITRRHQYKLFKTRSNLNLRKTHLPLE